jgi:hypothetical protein
MTEDEIIKMLRASCNPDIVDPWRNGFWVILTEELKDFAKLVAQHEREACIKALEDQIGWDMYDPESTATKVIRARGQA